MTSRVWDPFLTEQDKAHLAGSTHRKMGSASGLRSFSLTYTAGSSAMSLSRWWRPSRTGQGAVVWLRGTRCPISRPFCKQRGTTEYPVIHVTGLDHAGIEGWTVRREAENTPQLSPEAADRRHRRWEIIDEVAPIEGEAVLRKSSPSAFWGTPLAGHLNYLDADTIIVCGESTSGCVRSSVVDGCTNRYRMVVVEECVFDRHEASHAHQPV